MAYFPMFVSLEGKKCLVLGAGKTAKRKADTLLSYGADVWVIAPDIKYDFNGCTVIKREMRDSDINDCFMVIAATNKTDVNEKIGEIALKRGIHINRADKGGEGSFMFGASFKRGNMSVAVNSGEDDPCRSKEVKNNIMNYLNKNTIRIGTRKSKLAKIQTDIVADAIKTASPGIMCEIVEISTEGDENLNKDLTSFGGKGAFTGSLERALLSGDIDIAVHSGKDLPLKLGEGLEIIAVPKREDPRDVLVTLKGKNLNENSIIGTGSERRRLQTNHNTKGIRGNVETRLAKMEKGDYDGVILAMAGLKRLGIDKSDKYDYTVFDINEMYPAPCQGIIAVEGKKDNRFYDIVKSINDEDTFLSFKAERKIVTEGGMGCNFPVGIYSYVKGNEICIYVMFLGKYNRLFKKVCNKERAEEAACELAEEIKRFV